MATASPHPKSERTPSPLLRAGRVTQYLPAFKGLTFLAKMYKRVIPADALYRISNFDGSLKLDVNVGDCIGVNLWHAPNLYEKDERALFCSAITPNAVVLDVGANIGIYSLVAAKRGAKVFAIEADPLNAELLRRHIEMNTFKDSVTVHEMAAVSKPQTLTFYRSTMNSGGTSLYGKGDAVSVKGNTIDSLNFSSIDVCKMDIEGGELDALRGMEETIKRSPKMKMLVECTNHFGHQAELVDFVRSRFKNVKVVGAKDDSTAAIPAFCNLWAFN